MRKHFTNEIRYKPTGKPPPLGEKGWIHTYFSKLKLDTIVARRNKGAKESIYLTASDIEIIQLEELDRLWRSFERHYWKIQKARIGRMIKRVFSI